MDIARQELRKLQKLLLPEREIGKFVVVPSVPKMVTVALKDFFDVSASFDQFAACRFVEFVKEG